MCRWTSEEAQFLCAALLSPVSSRRVAVVRESCESRARVARPFVHQLAEPTEWNRDKLLANTITSRCLLTPDFTTSHQSELLKTLLCRRAFRWTRERS